MKKRKFSSSEEKRKFLKCEQEWKELKLRHGCTEEKIKQQKLVYNISSCQRATTYIPSKESFGGSTSLKPSKVYTGTKMMGIAVLHKSNSVPIFTEQEAKDVSSMRR